MDNKTTYKFGWTRKDPDGSYHKVEGDTVDEVMTGMDELEQRISTRLGVEKPVESHPEGSDTPEWMEEGGKTLNEKFAGKTMDEIPEVDESYCQVHEVKMKERTGKNGTFYSHAKGDYPDLKWCSGKGFKE